MAVTGVPTITAPGIPTDASRSFPVRDQLLAGVANSGVRFLFDLAFPWCYPGGAPTGRPAAGAPTAGAVVQDMTERANGSAQLGQGAAGSIAYAGGGFDLTNSAIGGGIDAGVVIPASVLADLATAFNGKVQRYLFCMYLKLPSAANWPSSASIVAIAGDKSFQTGPSLINIAEAATLGQVQIRRQTAAGASETVGPATAETEDFATVCQIAGWRSDTGQGVRIKSLTSGKAAKTATLAVGNDNTQDFSANTFTMGRCGSFSGGTAGVYSAYSGVRLYRGWVENLARSGRDPLSVLDADYARQVARGLFS